MHVLGELAEQTSEALIPQKEEEKKEKKKHLKRFTEKPISPTIYLAKLGSYCLLMLLTILIFHHEPPTNLYELIPLLSFTLSNH